MIPRTFHSPTKRLLLTFNQKKSVYLLNCWYTRKEIALRTAILYSGLVLAQALSGVLAAGIFSGMEGLAGLAGWKWLFIIESLTSTVCGIFAFWTLPDYPHSKTGSQRYFMTEDMRRLAEARIVADRVTGSSGTGRVVDGIKLAVTDLKTWSFVSYFGPRSWPITFPCQVCPLLSDIKNCRSFSISS